MFLVLEDNPQMNIKIINTNKFFNLSLEDLKEMKKFNDIYSLDYIDFSKFKNV